MRKSRPKAAAFRVEEVCAKGKVVKPLFISVKDLCSLLGIGRTKAYELLSSGSIQSAHIGRRRMVYRKSAKNFADSVPSCRENADGAS
ncbi:helix-turn-helix domain-containing protein [Sphingobium sp. RAC03]|uniref:helix-turn-helix domain-containing protein n=1 Tax=Sphingobium sp. RAC03 TaxID=1843368 RepID=UPI0009F22CBF|nr:helix-turn-helix domain-containing protein [Sphingobium sp. RAC03]